MTGWVKIRWDGDNFEAIQRALANYGEAEVTDLARCVLTLRAHELSKAGFVLGTEINVQLGETIEIRPGETGQSDTVGIHRLPDAGPEHVTWKGDNIFEVRRFVARRPISIEMRGENLVLQNRDNRETYVMRRGDRLVDRGGRCYMSRAGQEHRV